MKKLFIQAIKSRTVWSAIAGLVLALLQAYKGFIEPDVFTLIMIGVTTLVTYFKLNPSQHYGK